MTDGSFRNHEFQRSPSARIIPRIPPATTGKRSGFSTRGLLCSRCWPLPCSVRRSTAGTIINSSEQPGLSWKEPISWRPRPVISKRDDPSKADKKWLTSAEYLHRYLKLRPEEDAVRIRMIQMYDRGAKSWNERVNAIDLYYQTLGLISTEEEIAVLRRRLTEMLLEIRRYSQAEIEAAKLDDKDSQGWRFIAVALHKQLQSGAAIGRAKSPAGKSAARRDYRQGHQRAARPPNIQVGPGCQSRRHPTLGDFGELLPRQGTPVRREASRSSSPRTGEKGRGPNGQNGPGQPKKRGCLPCPLLLSRPEPVAGIRRRPPVGLEIRAGQHRRVDRRRRKGEARRPGAIQRRFHRRSPCPLPTPPEDRPQGRTFLFASGRSRLSACTICRKQWRLGASV